MSEVVSAERTRVKAKQSVSPASRPADVQMARRPAEVQIARRPADAKLANPPADAQSAKQPADASNRVAELQVTAHLMTLETGLFCVFQTPGSPPPDQATGLPGVRITPAPGLAGRPEAVSVSTFRDDGWLNGTAALVRVTDRSAQILVTIYQQKGMDAAPRLQVLRLSAEPAAADAQTAGIAAAKAIIPATASDGTDAESGAPVPNPEVMAHVQRAGDVTCMLGAWLGLKGSRQWVEGFGLAPANGISPQDIEYQAVLGRNWLSPWVEGGKFCGSRGMALPLLGLKVRLKGAAAKAFECSYAATFVDGSAVGPVSGGEACEAESLAALEAFQIVIQPRGGKAATATASPVKTHRDKTAAQKLAAQKPAAQKPAAMKTQAAKMGAPPASVTAIKPRIKA